MIHRPSRAASLALPISLALSIAGCPCEDAKGPPCRPVQLSCDSEVAYQGVKVEGSVHVLNIAGGKGAFNDTALRDVNQAIERYIAGQTRLCREYNACIVDGPTYHAEAAKAREHLAGLEGLADQYNSAKSVPDRAKAADAIYAKTSGRTETPLSFRMVMEAAIPDALGGGNIVVPPNYPLPTGARVAFTFQTSNDAYVYIFQVNAQKEVSVLFPDERIDTRNPLPGGTPKAIPPSGQRFRLDDKGVGVENVYLVVSRKPIEVLNATLRKFADGNVALIGQDSLLAGFGTVAPGSPPAECGTRTRDLKLESSNEGAAPGCTRTRGLVLDDAPEPGRAVTHSMEARTETGDDTIVKVFPFQHVVEGEYRAKVGAYNAPTPEGTRTRGIVIEN